MNKDVVGRSSSVVILSFPQYCRYRAVERRLEAAGGSAAADGFSVSDTVLRAVGRPRSASLTGAGAGVVRVMFCRSTFCHPDLDQHEFRRDLLSTSLCLSTGLSLSLSLSLSVCLCVCVYSDVTRILTDRDKQAMTDCH